MSRFQVSPKTCAFKGAHAPMLFFEETESCPYSKALVPSLVGVDATIQRREGLELAFPELALPQRMCESEIHAAERARTLLAV